MGQTAAPKLVSCGSCETACEQQTCLPLELPRCSTCGAPLPITSCDRLLSENGKLGCAACRRADGSFDAVLVHPVGFGVESAYVLGSTLGEGGYATVRWGCDQTGAARAVKSVRKDHSADSARVGRSEIKLMRLLWRAGDATPSFVVRLFEVYEDSQCLHLVLELCTGGELFSRQGDVGAFPDEEAKALAWQMYRAVRFVHGFRILHRDLKLENWLFARNLPSLELRLCDFGLSVLLSPGQLAEECVGSVYYVAPEVLVGAYDLRADIWSLGVILHMLLTGLAPFDGDTDEGILLSVEQLRLSYGERAWQQAPAASIEARELVGQFLLRDPDERVDLDQALNSPWLRGYSYSPQLGTPRDAQR